MKIKNYAILLLLVLLTNIQLFAEEGRFHIYGKCVLVSHEELDGFIRFDDDHLWISQFTSAKLENPYASLFTNGDNVFFGDDRQSKPDLHLFVCRYNDLKQLRPIANNRLRVTIKGDRSIDVSFKFNINPVIYLNDGTSRELNWEDVASINFTTSPDCAPASYKKLYVGSVSSKQGSYFGVVDGLNYKSKSVPIQLNSRWQDRYDEVLNLKDIEILKYKQNPPSLVRISLPTIGIVEVPWRQLESIIRYDSDKLHGATYDSSPATPSRLTARVELHGGHVFSGPIAYDLDEALNIEFIDGKNDGFVYSLQLDKIDKIEPRNYKYSLITLKNGGRLSLGDLQDVTMQNNGVLMLNTNTYIPWSEIVMIQFESK